MIELRLAEVAAAVGGRLVGSGDLTIAAVTTDSRAVAERALFVALRGEHADGHDYLEDARANGAVAMLVERDDARGDVVVGDTWEAIGHLGAAVRDRVGPVAIGITGSVGKTTTKDLTAAAVGAARRVVAAEGSYNNELGVPLTLLALEHDSEVVICELGARGIGHIAALTPLVAPRIGIVTRVAGAHLELFGDLDTVAVAKGELVACLPSDGTAILNADDPRVLAMAERTDANVLTYAVHQGADVTARDLRLDRLAHPTFTAVTPWGEVEVTLPVAGTHHASNALAALAAAGACEVPIDAAAAALATARISRWRSEVVDADGVVVLNDAYNANPTSVRAALDTLVRIERTGRTWAVLGVMAEMGASHEADHRGIGAAVVEHGVDRLVVVGEAAGGIADGARSAGLGDDVLWRVDDAAGALALLRDRVRSGDVVLVKASRVGGLEAVADGLTSRGEGAA